MSDNWLYFSGIITTAFIVFVVSMETHCAGVNKTNIELGKACVAAGFNYVTADSNATGKCEKK